MKQFIFFITAVILGAFLGSAEPKMFMEQVLFFAFGYAVSYFWGRPTLHAPDKSHAQPGAGGSE
jgi:hypothetical protein